MILRLPSSTLFPYTTLFRSVAGIVDDGMLHNAAFLRNGRALEPRGTLLQVFLEETLFADPAVIPLHRDRASANVGKHSLRDGLVVLGELTLGDAVIRKQHLVRVGDVDDAHETSTSLTRRSRVH